MLGFRILIVRSNSILLTDPEEIRKYKEGQQAIESKKCVKQKLMEYQARLKELRGSMVPIGQVIRLASIRRVTEKNPHYGYWTHNLKHIACCGSAIDKARFTSGFAKSYGGHHFGGGVWFGEDAFGVLEYLGNWNQLPTGTDLERFKFDLERLAAGETEEISFPHPERKGEFPVYVVTPAYLEIVRSAEMYGDTPPVSWSDVPLHDEPNCSSNQWNRYIQLGDHIVVDEDGVHYYIPGAEQRDYRYVTS